MSVNPSKVIDAAAYASGPSGLATWIALHIAQINSFLQAGLLIVSIGATIAAWRYHWRKTRSE